ncbi:glutamine--tRNA ligase/YqeY domain fusion protein [Pelagibaculum spongiae]|uniref:Glutamine--tRNA ligase n=1 Tax=Pelagibaculum spongiae TaxID=2080658 RepID=A0A2V1H0Z1_9GAMM|nr:glutamine--tRNA ligase/YqeY domain fusion protein [Pelagibaculum spongiae]PVZ68969.1 glutamine--tRNA ligase [Pelagibaculum spongiae]
MSEAESKAGSNFVKAIVAADLESGKYQAIQTRFPPEPNGYLHLGHAKSICLNFGLAKAFGGECNLRMDDSNPTKEDIEYVNSIAEDVKWLGFEWAGDIKYTSSYFDQLYRWAEELVEKGLAYVCELDAEQTREYRGSLTEAGKHSPWRDRSVEENLDLLRKMKAGEFKDGEKMLRAKINMAAPDMCMRDPVMYRIRHVEHHQTGNKWCIYPMYDFAHGLSDALEGVSHSVCTLEFAANRPLYNWFIDNCTSVVPAELGRPHQYEFSRLSLEYTVLSKRRLIQLVDDNHVNGWDDPRMPTVSGLRRRGYTSASIREFCDRIGVTKSDGVVEMASLESCIREDLENSACRAMCVLDPVKVIITNYPADKEVEWLTAPSHQNIPELGERQLPFTKEIWIDRADFREEANKKFKRMVTGGEVRLRNSYCIRADEVIKDESGEIIELRCSYDENTLGVNPEGRKVRGVIHWVSASHGKQAEVRIYDPLFSQANPMAAEDFLSTLNPDSLTVKKNAWIEPSLVDVAAGTNFQFEREGYYVSDPDSTAEKMVFNRTVPLRDTWAKIEKKN